MLKALRCNSLEHCFQRVTSLAEAKQALAEPQTVLWLDLFNPSQEELQDVGVAFHLHPLAVEDAGHKHQRPKIEEYDNFYLLVFYTVQAEPSTDRLRVCELSIFLGERYLITVHSEPIPELEETEQRWTRNVRQLEGGVIVLLYSLLDTIVDQYFPVLDAMVEQAEALEDRLFSGELRQRSFTQDLLALKKRFLTLRRIAGPERDVLNVLTNRDNPLFNEHALLYFRDVYDHVMRVADTVDLYRDQLSSTMDANLSIVSNDLNKTMRTLTAASIVLMVDALLAGIWGMNFEYMPELHWTYGYALALMVMAVISLLLLLIFRRLRWL
ncbi:MAG: magnesium/cobalt transporter CorA [Thermogemmatispora sp.]|uniref:magnesium/cobalt transporter CorA n=1 Tax=Thermogemmatispora sp. TaxID=1968838 RepID=UPI00261D27B4|nr:magnesium/cobalt transporter CorA [Thermogemmatispora sp.]MBX5456006.1 magnesium/cobalt transporter CorA [Thermogemmatispora sp.]